MDISNSVRGNVTRVQETVTTCQTCVAPHLIVFHHNRLTLPPHPNLSWYSQTTCYRQLATYSRQLPALTFIHTAYFCDLTSTVCGVTSVSQM